MMKSGRVSGRGGSFSTSVFVKVGMGEVDAVVEDGGLTKDHIFRADSIGLLGVFASVEPREVADGRAVGEMGDDALLTGSHRKGLEAEDMTHHLHVGHIARQFVDGVDLRAVNVFVGIVFEQVTIGLDAEFAAQHLLAVGAYARQELDVL